jgi:hypothetical protein
LQNIKIKKNCCNILRYSPSSDFFYNKSNIPIVDKKSVLVDNILFETNANNRGSGIWKESPQGGKICCYGDYCFFGTIKYNGNKLVYSFFVFFFKCVFISIVVNTVI